RRPAPRRRRPSPGRPSPAPSRRGSVGCPAWRLALRVEGAAHVLERRRLAIEAHADHVEPDVGLGETASGEEVTRHQREPRLLARVDRFARRAHGLTATAAHLDEAHGAPVERHEVDLTGPASEVALHDGVPAGAEQLLRQRFTAPPELPPPVHGAGDYSAAGGLATRARHHTAMRPTVVRAANPMPLREVPLSW